MTRYQANIVLLVAAFMWGSGNVAQQTVLEHIGPLTTTGLKSLIAAIVILPYCLTRPRSLEPLGWHGAIIGLVVILSFCMALTALQMGYGLTSVTNAGFLVNTATVLTPILAWLLLRNRPGYTVWLAAIAAFSGAALMSGASSGSLGPGDLLCLVSAVCFAVWMISLGEFVNRFGRAGPVTIIQFAATALICTPLGVATEAPSFSALGTALPELLFIGAISTGGGYLLQAIAQRHTPASEAAVIVSAEAVFGAIAAFMILGESLTSVRAVGAVLISAGIILVQLRFGSLRRPAVPSPAPMPSQATAGR